MLWNDKKLATCKGCGAKILWVKTAEGNNMPCDPELISVDDCDVGTVLVTVDGDVLKVTSQSVVSGEDCQPAEGYVSHFATCPEAEKFRKRKQQKE